MQLSFRRHILPGGVRAPVALFDVCQGNNNACVMIALHLGAAWSRKQELSTSSLWALVQRALVAYKAVSSDPSKLLDAGISAQRVPGVQHLGPSLQVAVAPAASGSAALTPVAALQQGIDRLGSNSGFISFTHACHTVALLPERNSAGQLVALILFNFLGHYLLPIGSADSRCNYPGFAVRMEETQRHSLWEHVEAVIDSLYRRRYEGIDSMLLLDVAQIDVFHVQQGVCIGSPVLHEPPQACGMQKRQTCDFPNLTEAVPAYPHLH